VRGITRTANIVAMGILAPVMDAVLSDKELIRREGEKKRLV